MAIRIDRLSENQTFINGRWIEARPINYKFRTIADRVLEAWDVFTGVADAAYWPEDQ